jgi:hypothetical protein
MVYSLMILRHKKVNTVEITFILELTHHLA